MSEKNLTDTKTFNEDLDLLCEMLNEMKRNANGTVNEIIADAVLAGCVFPIKLYRNGNAEGLVEFGKTIVSLDAKHFPNAKVA